MAEIIFNYKGNEIEIQCNLNEKIKNIFNKYETKIGMDISKLYFIYNGNIIDDNNLILNEIINEEDKRRKILNILVNENDENDEIIIKENTKTKNKN